MRSCSEEHWTESGQYRNRVAHTIIEQSEDRREAAREGGDLPGGGGSRGCNVKWNGDVGRQGRVSRTAPGMRTHNQRGVGKGQAGIS